MVEIKGPCVHEYRFYRHHKTRQLFWRRILRGKSACLGTVTCCLVTLELERVILGMVMHATRFKYYEHYYEHCCCSREFIRFALDDEEMEVPSPTFLLHNMYSGMNDGPPMIHHYDLYRLLDENYSGVERLDFENTVRSGVCLVEWPQVLEPLGLVPDERVELSFRLTSSSSPPDEKDERIIDIRGFGPQWTRVVETLSEHIEQRGDALGLQYLSV